MTHRSKLLAGSRLAAPGTLAAGLAIALVACCDPARAGSGCEDDGHAAAVAAPVAAFDPSTFVGPPAPLGVLFAPAMAPGAAGLRFEIEGAGGPLPTAALRPVAGERLRMVWDADVLPGLREVVAPGGGYLVDLQGAFLDLATITIDAGGRPVLGCAQQPRATARPASRPRPGRE